MKQCHEQLDVPDMFSKAGTSCYNYGGYCDVFQKCCEVDPAGKFTVKFVKFQKFRIGETMP